MIKIIYLGIIAVFLLLPSVLGASWSGYVLDNASAAINAANVSAINASNGVYLNSTLTDAAGFFNISLPDNTSVRLNTSQTGYQDDITIALPGRADDLTLPFNITLLLLLRGNITGVVRENGNAIANANVSALQGGTVKGSDITDAGGYYSITDLLDGTYTVSMTTGGITQNITNVVVFPGAVTVLNVSVALAASVPVSEATTVTGIMSGGRFVEDWICSAWSSCTPDGIQARSCLGKWGFGGDKPDEERPCVYAQAVEEKPKERALPEEEHPEEEQSVVAKEPLIPLGTGVLFISFSVILAAWIVVYRLVKGKRRK